jgi:phospholipase/carboxylesterase
MMNRLQNPFSPALASLAPSVDGVFVGKFFGSTESADHALFAPLHYEGNYAYPLVVWLHGSGGSAGQLRRIMPLISLRNYVAVAPQGTQRAAIEKLEGSGGYGWVQSPEHISQAEQRVQAAIGEARQRFNICAERVFLAGYGSGGTMAMRIAALRPREFAGVVSLSGPFPTQGAPLANLNSMRRLPLFVASCRHGVDYPNDRVCDDLRLLHSAGMSITLRDYPGDDGLSAMMLADVNRWLMEQIAAPSSLVESTPPVNRA